MFSKSKLTINKLNAMKRSGEKISMLTAYDYPTAMILDNAGIDIILVGDSLGNVVLGYENTLPVTMEEMVHHTKAVSRAANNSMVIADMPLEAFQSSVNEALNNALRFIEEAGAHAVKVEGVDHMESIKMMVKSGIPVMGHIGFTPQDIDKIGGYKVQGRSEEEQKTLIESAKLLEKAGVFAIVIEMVPENAAKNITESIEIPTISCGAGKYCDGQVLVFHDFVGMYNGKTPKFAKRYLNLKEDIKKAVTSYIKDVKTGAFPAKEQTY